MIELLINHQPADLPADFSFSMEYENEFFTKSSEYSLDIELPLKGSAANQRIFGQLHRITSAKEAVTMPAEAYVGGRCVAYGEAIVISLTDLSVTIQLVGSTSYINYVGSDLYIDEMPIEDAANSFFMNKNIVDIMTGVGKSCKESDYKILSGNVDDADMVFLWSFYKDPKDIVFDGFFLQYLPNCPFPSFSEDGSSSMFFSHFYESSCQPYLLTVIDRIIRSMGFIVRRNDIRHSWLRNIYLCNYKIGNINDWNTSISGIIHTDIRRALPHWRLSTFIDEVEKFCACIFLFNSHNRTVDIVMLDKFYDEQASLYTIQDGDILDEFEVEFDDTSSDKDLTTSSISFEHSYTDPYLKVSKEVLDAIESHQHYADLAMLQQAYDKMTDTERRKTLFTDDSTGREYIHYEDDKGAGSLKEVNLFGDLLREDTYSSVSMKIVPANTRLFDVGWWFDSFQGKPSQSLKLNVPFTTTEVKTPEYTKAQEIIENSYSPEREESSDCMEVMLHTGDTYPIASYKGTTFRYPVPFTDFDMPGATKGHLPEMSLSLKPVCKQSLGYLYRHIPSYRSDKKYVIRFLDRHVPDQRQIFLLHNQRYVCYKLSADFDNRTRDFLIEGEFFRID
ncbi:MAG: hypothetical protein ACI37U_10420 [Bacteroides sp.]